MKIALIGLTLVAGSTMGSAKLVTKTINYEQGGISCQGYLAYDDSVASKRPGVLVISEWWGLNDFTKGKTDALAQLGYVAFAADMYGAGKSTTDRNEAQKLSSQLYGKPLMAERAQAALQQLLDSGLVADGKVAAIGFCFGGATCQVLAYSGAPLQGIVSFHGGLIPAPPGAAEKNHARFLILNGALDPTIKKDQREAFIQSLNDGKFDYEFIDYSGAMHGFMNPDADKARAAGLSVVAYNPVVAKRAWEQMQLFFRDLFGTGS